MGRIAITCDANQLNYLNRVEPQFVLSVSLLCSIIVPKLYQIFGVEHT